MWNNLRNVSLIRTGFLNKSQKNKWSSEHLDGDKRPLHCIAGIKQLSRCIVGMNRPSEWGEHQTTFARVLLLVTGNWLSSVIFVSCRRFLPVNVSEVNLGEPEDNSYRKETVVEGSFQHLQQVFRCLGWVVYSRSYFERFFLDNFFLQRTLPPWWFKVEACIGYCSKVEIVDTTLPIYYQNIFFLKDQLFDTIRSDILSCQTSELPNGRLLR